MESEHYRISNNLEVFFIASTFLEQIKYLDYSQLDNVHFLTVGEIIIVQQSFDFFRGRRHVFIVKVFSFIYLTTK